MFERACTAVWHYSLVPLRWFKEPSAEALMVGLEEFSLSPVFKPWINPVFMKKKPTWWSEHAFSRCLLLSTLLYIRLLDNWPLVLFTTCASHVCRVVSGVATQLDKKFLIQSKTTWGRNYDMNCLILFSSKMKRSTLLLQLFSDFKSN